jgi:uncharacterized membrane protein
MALLKQLSRWQAAGLIDDTTKQRIVEFEAKRGRPRVVYGLAALGAVSIGVGLISIVAANWDGIGPHTKLAVDVTLAVLLALGMRHAVRRQASLAAEALGLVYYLFTLASLALVGQVYQLGTPAWLALALWSLVTLPLALSMRSPLAGAVWLVGSSISYAMSVTELVELVPQRSLRADLGAGALAAWPLLVMLLARLPWHAPARRRIVQAVDVGARGAVVLAGLLLPFAFYADVSRQETLGLGLVLSAAACLGLHLCLQRWVRAAPKRARTSVSLLLASTWLTLALGVGLPHSELDLVGALLQVTYLGLLGFSCLQFGWVRAFHALTAVIAVRILILYFEVFGSMLSTGLGLVTGGVLTLLLAWLWKRKSPEFAARFDGETGARHAA